MSTETSLLDSDSFNSNKFWPQNFIADRLLEREAVESGRLLTTFGTNLLPQLLNIFIYSSVSQTGLRITLGFHRRSLEVPRQIDE